MKKSLSSKYLRYFNLFYKYLSTRIFKLLFLSFFVGLFDGFGIALFIPLIQSSMEGINNYSESFGNFSFIFSFFERIGFEINIYFILYLMIFLFFFKGILKFLDTYYKTLLQSLFVKKLRYKLVNSLGDIKFFNFLSLDSGEIQNTLSGEVYKVTASFISFFNSIQSVVLLLVYFGLAFFANWQFAILVSFGGWLSNFLFKRIFYYTELASKNISSSSHKLQSYIIQAVQHFKYLKATAYYNNYKGKLFQSIDEIEVKQKKIGFYNAILQGAREPVILIVIILVVFIHIRFIGGEIVSIAMSLMFFYRALIHVMTVQSSWQGFLSNIGGIYAAENLIKIMDIGKEVIEEDHQDIPQFNFEINSVSFEYSSFNKTLDNVSLSISDKETVGFVGPSGSGKSTLVNLIVGLIKPNDGEILISGKPLHDYNLLKYREKIGYITQEPVIFNDSVFNNVTFWAEKNIETFNFFQQALQLAHLTDFVASLEFGHDTLLGDNGASLSGGQKQRISIAREIFKKVNLMVFDEATSALDSYTENEIQKNIDNLKGYFTIFIIAHRLSTVKNCDKIVIINEGKISAVGTFDFLLQNNFDFQEMVRYQKF